MLACHKYAEWLGESSPNLFQRQWAKLGGDLVHVPTLFSMMFSAILTGAFQDRDASFPIQFDDSLFNIRRL